ncbi:MAG: hypothetical protein DRN20_01865 [Thermoplasmata archaeon]|nr:MAG: hypothetical protein DRN20_01865 [Thermoplasmata archaeon]
MMISDKLMHVLREVLSWENRVKRYRERIKGSKYRAEADDYECRLREAKRHMKYYTNLLKSMKRAVSPADLKSLYRAVFLKRKI